MIKHIVMWRLRPENKAENAALIKARLESLRGRIPGMHSLEVGVDFSGETDAADVVLYCEFEDRDALEGYHRHPEHEAVKPLIKSLRTERRVVDYEC